VFNDRVILDRGGRLETLQLPRYRGSANSNDTSPAARLASVSTPVSNPQIATRLLRGLGTTQLTVTIERGGETLQAVLNQ
jgi:hypothetical protein